MDCFFKLNLKGQGTLPWRVTLGVKRDLKPTTPPRTSSSTMLTKGAMLGWLASHAWKFETSSRFKMLVIEKRFGL